MQFKCRTSGCYAASLKIKSRIFIYFNSRIFHYLTYKKCSIRYNNLFIWLFLSLLFLPLFYLRCLFNFNRIYLNPYVYKSILIIYSFVGKLIFEKCILNVVVVFLTLEKLKEKKVRNLNVIPKQKLFVSVYSLNLHPILLYSEN